MGLILESGRSPGEGNGNPPQYSSWKIPWTEEPGGGYNPWSHKESDTTEQQTLSLSFKGIIRSSESIESLAK